MWIGILKGIRMSVEAFAIPRFISNFFCQAKNISQHVATGKGLIIDICHAVGDGDGGQAAATTESLNADGCHAVADGDGGQAAATVVSITDYISILSLLNGRKVKS